MEEFRSTALWTRQTIQIASLLPAVARQQNVAEYWQKGSTSSARPPASASHVMG